MVTLASPGLATGLDVNGIVSKMMELEKIPLTRLNTKETAYQAKITAFGALKSSLASLETATKTLADTATFTSKSTTVSDSTVLTASASSAAAAGIYNLSVTQLAKAHTVRSNTNYAATTATFNTGSLAITVGGGATVNVTIDGTNNTLAGIRQAINDAGTDVTATIINDGTTNRLVLASKASGLANTVNVVATDDGSGGDNALLALDSASLVETQAPKDAWVNINGVDITRTSNTITDAIEGVTLNLVKGTVATPGTATLTIAANTAATTDAVEAFVEAYNAATTLLKNYSAYDAATKKGAALNGDSTVRSLQSQLTTLVQTSVTGIAGGISTLTDLGITMQTSGKLALNSTTLAAALEDPDKDVSSLFTQTTVGNEGIAVRFNTALDTFIGFGGLIANRTDGLTASIKDISNTRYTLNARLVQIEARYRAKFTALDTLATSMNKTSQYLSQQLGSLSSS